MKDISLSVILKRNGSLTRMFQKSISSKTPYLLEPLTFTLNKFLDLSGLENHYKKLQWILLIFMKHIPFLQAFHQNSWEDLV